jgi:hypothetical protein
MINRWQWVVTLLDGFSSPVNSLTVTLGEIVRGISDDGSVIRKASSIHRNFGVKSLCSVCAAKGVHTITVAVLSSSFASILRKLVAGKDLDGRPSSARYFSIDGIFGDETVDDTHLAEVRQVEGIIVV